MWLGRALICAVAMWVAGAWLGAVRPAGAQPRQPLTQLFHQPWGVREGVPGAVFDVTQSTDGFLWIATPLGAYRFDGVRFEQPTALAADHLRGLSRVVATPDGAVWLGHRIGAVSRYRDGQVTTFGAKDGIPAGIVMDLVTDASGAVWVLAARGVARWQGERWVAVGAAEGVPAGEPAALTQGADGRVWLGVGDQVLVREPGQLRFRLVARTREILHLAPAGAAAVWVSTRPGGLQRVTVDGSASAITFADELIRHMLIDSRGALWVTTNAHGVWRVSAPREHFSAADVESFGAVAGLTNADAFDIFEDRESNVWIGTGGGLDMLRETALVSGDFPPRTHAARLAPAPDGSMYVASEFLPLMRWRDGRVTRLPVAPPVTAVAAAADGVYAWNGQGLWSVVDDTARRLEGPPVPPKTRARGMIVDGRGQIWLTLATGEVQVRDGERWAARPMCAGPRGAFFAVTDARGRVWTACGDNQVAVTEGGRTRRISTSDGLRVGFVNGLSEGDDGMWVGGARGVAAIKDGRVRMLPGLTDVIGRSKGLVVDAGGGLWINADRGIAAIDAAEVARGLAGLTARPRVRVFDHLDGAIGGAAPLPQQTATRTADGRLWFVGFDHVVWLDPARIPRNPTPPSVVVGGVRAGDRVFADPGTLMLPVATTQVQIAYTALSLSMPSRVHFRYRLDGVDDDWREAGTRREAFYTNLGPGTYTFRVRASNNDGVWTETGASRSFTIPPALHQTGAFRLTLVLAALAMAWSAYRWRVRQITAQVRATLGERLLERERIARELHDTLLQGVQGLILKFHAATGRLAADDPTRLQLEETLKRADRVLAESRDRVQDLRGTAELPELAEALAQDGAELADGSPTRFSVELEGTPRPLHPVVRDELYWIGREAILNAFRHARATAIEVQVSYDDRELVLRCRDDGRGVAAAPATAPGSAQRWGVQGMRERAASIGGHFELWSRPGAGSEVQLRVPASTAYAAAAAARSDRRWWPAQTGVSS